MSEDIYLEYKNYIKKDFSVDNFKQDPKYQKILEHVSPQQGLEYEKCIKEKASSLDLIKAVVFIHLNDNIGNPHKINSPLFGMMCSPTSLRYIYQAMNIAPLIKDLPIVEIGGGYGGLCTALHIWTQIDKYTIVDLPEANIVQKAYLSKTPYQNTILQDTTFQLQEESFLISNYALAEIPLESQYTYRKNIIPLCVSGYLIWNTIVDPKTVLLKDFEKSEEIPLTGPHNYVITF